MDLESNVQHLSSLSDGFDYVSLFTICTQVIWDS